MLSGFFTLDRRHDKKFYLGALLSIILPAILAKGLYLAIDIRSGLDDTSTILRKTFLFGTSSSYHMWFVSSIIMLYAISPLLKSIKQHLMVRSRAIYTGFAIVMLLAGTVQFYLIEVPYYFIFLRYIGYYVLGDLIKTFHKGEIVSKEKNVSLIVCSILLLMGSGILNKGFQMGSKFLAPEFPLVVLASVIIFRVFLSLRVKKNYYAVARYTYVTYLFHVFGIMVAEKVVNTVYPALNRGQSVLVFAIAVIISFAIGCYEYHFRMAIQVLLRKKIHHEME